MELVNFARFHAREGKEAAVAAALAEQVPRVLTEPGCLAMSIYRAVRDPRLFFLQSRWVDEPAFQVHADLPSTVGFVERMGALIDHPFDSNRTRVIA